MEMPELNEDILEGEGESHNEMLNQVEDAASLDESTLQSEDQSAMDVDSCQQKPEDSEGKMKEQLEDNESTIEDADLGRPNDELSENLSKEDVAESAEDKPTDEEPARKKIKLEEDEDEVKMLQSEPDSDIQELKQEPVPGSGSEVEPEPQSQANNSSEQQSEAERMQEVAEIKKEDAEEKTDRTENKEDNKGAACPDTDMLATLASAALEQDPKDKVAAAAAAAPKSPVQKSESETPKKKQEMWCNVGVFDTNTTIVADYLATPEPNEHVDLVTATLTGRRIQLEPGTAYKFRVCAVNGCGTGPWSDVAAFKTTLPGFPGAPSAIKISKSPEGAHLTWEPPGGNSSEILEYAVYLAVRSASQGCQPVTTNQAQLAFVRVFCGPTNKCMVGTNSLQAAHIDTTTKPAIIFRIAARNSKGYGPATQVRWLQESQNGNTQGVKRAVKA